MSFSQLGIDPREFAWVKRQPAHEGDLIAHTSAVLRHKYVNFILDYKGKKV